MELFSPDKPIDTEKEDRFQRYKFAARIAHIVSTGNYQKSLVVGIYGKWGEGKTSVMNFVRNELSENVVVINFNPWLFTEERQLIKASFASIANVIGRKLKNKGQRAAKLLADYAEGIGLLTNLAIPWSSAFLNIEKKYTPFFL